MWEKIRVVFTIPELRKKIIFTLLLLAIYRVGWQIPLPLTNQRKMAVETGGGGLGDLLNQVATFSASQLNQATVFGLGIMPYISASIIFQLLASVYPPLEKLQKEGESGRKKINEYTRYATVLLCLGQSWFFLRVMISQGWIDERFLTATGGLGFGSQLTLVLTMTAGTVFLMWLGEQIDEYGIGNGISLLIMAGILARMPHAVGELIAPMVRQGGLQLGGSRGQMGVETLLLLFLMFVAIVTGVVFITQGQRRIPTQSAKHVRGRRVYGGSRNYLPLRVNQAGVMPIIFASSLLLFPQVVFQYLGRMYPSSFWGSLEQAFHRGDSFTYNVLYIGLIYFFCYFWTAITFNPKDMSDNLKNYGTFIPGYRPGRRTADYLEKVMVRITYVGAGFLAVIAILPSFVTANVPGIDYAVAGFYGGTSLLIAVSVAFDLIQKIDSHLVMRNYRGLLEKG
jgi:preprotein translocase subunit SecY